MELCRQFRDSGRSAAVIDLGGVYDMLDHRPKPCAAVSRLARQLRRHWQTSSGDRQSNWSWSRVRSVHDQVAHRIFDLGEEDAVRCHCSRAASQQEGRPS
jgi:hypothetical protein